MNFDYTFTHVDKVNSDGSISKPNTFKREIKYFAGMEVEITVRKKRAKRSNEQNALYRAYVKLLSEATGYSADETHSILGYKFRLCEKVDEDSGEVFNYIKSTTQLNKLEFADHLTEIQRWCEDTFKFRLPNPGEQWQISKL